MTSATDMGGFPEPGVVPRVSPMGVSTFRGESWYLPWFKRPHSSMFTQLMGTFLSVVDLSDRMVVDINPNAAGAGYMRYLSMPILVAPYTVEVIMGASGTNTSANALVGGIGFCDGTKGETYYAGNSNSGPRMFGDTLAIMSTGGTGVNFLNESIGMPGALHGIRVIDDGTNRTTYYSSNGRDWGKCITRASNVFLVPTLMGLAFLNTASITIDCKFPIYHFDARGGVWNLDYQ